MIIFMYNGTDYRMVLKIISIKIYDQTYGCVYTLSHTLPHCMGAYPKRLPSDSFPVGVVLPWHHTMQQAHLYTCV